MPEKQQRDDQLRQWMQDYGTELYRICALMLRDAFLAEDATQEAFLRAYQRQESFRGDASARTWLVSIAMNVCRDMLRTPWHRHVDRRDISLLPEPSSSGDLPDRTVLEAVMGLPPKLREAVLLRYDQGMKIQEIADSLGLSASTVKHRLNQANDRLRKQLTEWVLAEP